MALQLSRDFFGPIGDIISVKCTANSTRVLPRSVTVHVHFGVFYNISFKCDQPHVKFKEDTALRRTLRAGPAKEQTLLIISCERQRVNLFPSLSYCCIHPNVASLWFQTCSAHRYSRVCKSDSLKIKSSYYYSSTRSTSRRRGIRMELS